MKRKITFIITTLIFSLIILPNLILAQPKTTKYQLEGLQAGAEILRDQWGIPHI